MRLSLFILVLVLTCSLIHFSFAFDTTIAEKEIDALQDIPKSDLRAQEAALENIYGTGSVLRWDIPINPDGMVSCKGIRKMGEMGFEDDEETIRLPPAKIDSTVARQVVAASYIAAEQVNKNPHGITLTPRLIYVITFGEGIYPLVQSQACYPAEKEDWSAYWFDSYTDVGLDHFEKEAEMLKNFGFLRQDFAFTPQRYPYVAYPRTINELGQPISPVLFEGINATFEASAARIAYAQWQLKNILARRHISLSDLSEPQLEFWTYLYFNAGNETALKYLTMHIRGGKVDDAHFIALGPSVTVSNGDKAQYNAIMRMATSQFLKKIGVFSMGTAQESASS
jgi:hypothetical protein